METRSATVTGVRMRWEEHGEGSPVVLVHGIPTSPTLWRHVVPLVKGAKCFAWEMVGYGQSMPEGASRDISVARQADYLLAWMKEMAFTRAVFVGHDLGGGVAQIAAVRHPRRCAAILLTNSISYDSWPIPSVKALRAMSGFVRRLPAQAVKLILSSLILRGHDDLRRAREAIKLHWSDYAAHSAAAAFTRQVRSLHVGDTLRLSGALRELNVPARIVWGAADQFQKVRYGERLARDLGTHLRRIEGGKHFTPEDHPEVIASAIRELLEAGGP